MLCDHLCGLTTATFHTAFICAARCLQVSPTAAGSFSIPVTPLADPIVLTADGAPVVLTADTTGCPSCTWSWAVTGSASCPVRSVLATVNSTSWTLSAGSNATSNAIDTSALSSGTLNCTATITAIDEYNEASSQSKAILVRFDGC